MKRRDWISGRLEAWGWHWAAKIQRGDVTPSVTGTLGSDGVGGGTPGSRVLYLPADWMRPDVLNTHRCVLTLADVYRDVVCAHYIYPERLVKTNCGDLGIAPSVYYWRLAKAKQLMRPSFINGVTLENVQLDAQALRV